MPPSICSRLVMFAPNAILLPRSCYERYRLDHEGGRCLSLCFEQELRDFLALRHDYFRTRQLNVLNERRSLESLHEPSQRLYVDRLPEKAELDFLGSRDCGVRTCISSAVP